MLLPCSVLSASKQYLTYLDSPEWRKLRLVVYAREGGECNRCQRTLKPGWHCHHRTYERLFNERLEDLEALCPSCHREHHAEQKLYWKTFKDARKRARKKAKQHGPRTKKSRRHHNKKKSHKPYKPPVLAKASDSTMDWWSKTLERAHSERREASSG